MPDTWRVIYRRDTGASVSILTGDPGPLPSEWSEVVLSDADSALLLDGAGRWDEATRTVVPVPPPPPVPSVWQWREWLARRGMTTDQIDAAVREAAEMQA